jgi:polysaccharide biosynthesis/export protein
VWKVTSSCALRAPRAVDIFYLVFAALVAGLLLVRGAPAADGNVQLVPGDQITVTVFGQADLSGTFQIDGRGFVELPLVGPIQVRQLTPQQCERAIEARLADGYLKRPVVSVRLGEVRPIYVVGDVRTPGAYPFRHGSTVLSAIAQAGGYGVEVAGTLSDFLLADERVRTLEAARRGMLVRLVRLEAQRDGETSFTPPSFQAGERDKVLEEVTTNEREAMRTQIDQLKQELALQYEQKPRLQEAYVSIEQQIAAEIKQSQLLQSQMKDMAELSSKGLSLRSREITLQRERAMMESNISRYRSELARLSVVIGEVDIKINDTTNVYKRRILLELDDLRRKVQEIDASLPSAREMRDVRSAQAANAAGVAQAPPSYRISLRRSVDDELRTLSVSGETLLEPGDVVEVKRLRMDTPGIVSGPTDSGQAKAGPSSSAPRATKDMSPNRSLAEGTVGPERTR